MQRHRQEPRESINPSQLVSTAPTAGVERSRVLEPIKHYFNATAYPNIEGLTVKVALCKLHQNQSSQRFSP